MSGGSIVAVQGGVGGIDAQVDDLRSGAQILGELGWQLGAETSQLRSMATLLCGDAIGPMALHNAGIGQVNQLADDARILAGLLDRAADQYIDSDSWTLSRIAGLAVGQVRNVTKGGVAYLTLGQVDVPWDYDLRPLEAGANLYHRTEMSSILHGFALLADWRVAPRVTSAGVDRAPAASRPPRSIDALLVNLEHRNRQEAGAVDIQILQSYDGEPRRVIVNIPGTSTFLPTLTNPTDVLADIVAINGSATGYGTGIIECLERAGVTALDSILLVGHSQGGLVAAQLAGQLSASGQFTVRNVLTVGAPISRIDLPPGVDVLALENEADAVPTLDGGRNSDSRDVVTVTVDTGASGVDAHGIDTGYRPAAADLDSSTDPSVQAALESLSVYLTADRVTTRTYVISRG